MALNINLRTRRVFIVSQRPRVQIDLTRRLQILPIITLVGNVSSSRRLFILSPAFTRNIRRRIFRLTTLRMTETDRIVTNHNSRRRRQVFANARTNSRDIMRHQQHVFIMLVSGHTTQ